MQNTKDQGTVPNSLKTIDLLTTRCRKCDETKPFCRRCVDSRRQCPGYKNELDLIFRNKTQETETKAMKAFEKASNEGDARSPTLSSLASTAAPPPLHPRHPIPASS